MLQLHEVCEKKTFLKIKLYLVRNWRYFAMFEPRKLPGRTGKKKLRGHILQG